MFTYIQNRERGLRHSIGYEDQIYKNIYTDLTKYSYWHSSVNKTSEFGGVYNLEFSPDGSLLVAACEKKSIVFFDPTTNKQTKAVKNAHQDSVNCVKFLSNTIFATCSDDTTVALWDKRNLSSKLRSLHGHMNWVKNIEYSTRESLLVTSGFDGSIFTWDINSTTEEGFLHKKVFNTSGLMRCRLSRDADQLVICTTGGYLIIIHDLDLSRLADDLRGFKPNVYRLMQLGRQFIPIAASYDHVFSRRRKRNRVELVSDFPNDAEVISSLQIHPHGWCALSRNISGDESSEYSCLHDIQKLESDEDSQCSDVDEKSSESPASLDVPKKRSTRNRSSRTSGSSRNRATGVNRAGTSNGLSESNSSSGSSGSSGSNVVIEVPTVDDLEEAIEDILGEAIEPPLVPAIPAIPRRRGALHSPHVDIWAAEVTIRDRAMAVRQNGGNSFTNTHVYGISSGVFGMVQDSTNDARTTEADQVASSPSKYRYMFLPSKPIPQNARRMLYYIEQPNKGQGLIKEECFSSCGRLICSPFGFGFRLLSYSPECSELPRALAHRTESRLMTELHQTVEHNDIVVSTRFSPTQPLLVSGCLKGRIHWHHPRI